MTAPKAIWPRQLYHHLGEKFALPLALRAVDGGTLAQAHTFERASALVAGFAVAAVYLQRLPEIPRTTLAVDKIAQRGAAVSNGGREDLADGERQRIAAGTG